MKELTKSFIQVFVLYSILFSVIFGSAIQVNYQIASIDDDTWFSDVGTQFQNTPYIPVIQTTTDVTGAIAFRNISVPTSSTVNEAILSLRTVKADNWTFGNPNMFVSIYGIRRNDLTIWSPPNNSQIFDLPLTSENVLWNVANQSVDRWVNISVTQIVQEIVSLYNWQAGNDIGFKFLAVSDFLPRYFKSFDGFPSQSARLFITYGVNTPPTPQDVYQETYRNQTIWNRTITGSGGNLTMIKLDDFTSNYSDIVIDGAPWQRKILYSNVTESYYVFYSTNLHPVYTGVTLYARFDSNGILQSQDNLFYYGLASAFRDLHDFDVAINRQGTRIYTIASYDLDAGDNGFNNANKETLRWLYHSVNISSNELDWINSRTLSDIVLQPFTDIDRYENTQISILPNGNQLVSFGSKDGAVYSAWCMLNNLTFAWNTRYGFNPESVMVDLTAWNPSNLYYHTLNMGNFNFSGVSFILRSRDAGFDWDYGGASTDDFLNEVNENAGYVYNGYTIANWESQGTDTGINQDHFGNLGRNSPTCSYSYDGTLYSDVFDTTGNIESWIYNNTDGDFNKEQNSITTPLFYTLEYGYAFEDGNISMIYSDGSDVWFGRNYNFSSDNWDNNYTLITMNSVITDAKGRQDYGSSLKMMGREGWNNFDNLNVGGAVSVIDDTGSNGNLTLYLLSRTDPDFRIVVFINGTLQDNDCLDQAYWDYQTHGNYTLYLERVKGCIDAIIGVDPQDPNPPASNYPDTGIFTRFGLRWIVLYLGFILIFGALCLMAWRTYSIEWYAIFIFMIITGLGLLWSVSSI
jgi:hypothetical protein